MKKSLLLTTTVITLIFSNCNAGNPTGSDRKSTGNEIVTQLTNETFKKKIYNYDVNKDWKYEGTTPAIIDFYADWCPPCRQLSPVVEEIAKEYAGKITVYKVNTDNERELTMKMGISSLPTLLFVPANGKPQYTLGAMPKSTLVKALNEILLVK